MRDERPMSSRAREDVALSARIHEIHRRSRGAYGAPIIQAELVNDHDTHVGCKRVLGPTGSTNLDGGCTPQIKELS